MSKRKDDNVEKRNTERRKWKADWNKGKNETGGIEEEKGKVRAVRVKD